MTDPLPLEIRGGGQRELAPICSVELAGWRSRGHRQQQRHRLTRAESCEVMQRRSGAVVEAWYATCWRPAPITTPTTLAHGRQ